MTNYPILNLPEVNLKIQKEGSEIKVFDIFRKKYVVLTPEEWVRQHFMHYLWKEQGYSKGLFRVERGHKYQKTKQKRTDIIVYNREGNPYILVECKSFYIPISQGVIDQVALYNQSIKAKYIAVTNGLDHLCAEIDYTGNRYNWLADFPKAR